jgi:hypothetical protein
MSLQNCGHLRPAFRAVERAGGPHAVIRSVTQAQICHQPEERDFMLDRPRSERLRKPGGGAKGRAQAIVDFCSQFSSRTGSGPGNGAHLVPAIAASAAFLFASPVTAGPIGGTMGTVSRATIGISVSVAPRVELMRAGATSVARLAGESGLRSTQLLCIWGNTALGTYQVTALGDAPQGFSLRDQTGRALPYSVEWTSAFGNGGAQPLSSGKALKGLEAATSAQCSGGATAGLVVMLPEAADRAPGPGIGGNLLLLVAPD